MSKKRILFISLILFCSLTPIYPVSAAWLNGWDQRVKITIDSDDFDYAVTHFPFLIYISSSSGINNEDITFIFDEIGASYQKLIVTRSDGITPLFVEVERWDNVNEIGNLWVSNSTWVISNTTDTEIYLYYDSAHANNTDYVDVIGSAVGEKVWNSNFVLVCHMAGTNKGTTLDSTSNDNDFDAEEGGNPTYLGSGIVGGYSIDYDGNADYNVINSDSELNSNDQTTEIIVKSNSATNPASQAQGILWKAAGTGFDREFAYTFATSTGTMSFGIGDNVDENILVISALDVYDAQWHYAVGTKDGTDHDSIEFFMDGLFQGTNSFVAGDGYQGADDIEIGRIANTVNALRYLDGDIDEIRVSDIIRSGPWMNSTMESIFDNTSDWGSVELSIQPPSDPGLLFGAGFNSSTPYVALHWNHSLEDVQFFEVQNSSDGISWDYLGQTTTANYTDSQVNNGTERYYRIRACNQTDGDWYNSSFTDVNFETVYFISGVSPGPPVIQNVTGEWFYYNLTSINVTFGTHDTGTVNSTLDIDGDTWNCSEVVGAPGYRLKFNWTDVDQDSHCLWVTAYVFYDGVSAHTITIDLLNFTSTAWVTIGTIYDMTGFEWVNSSIYDLRMPNDFINSTGAVLGRFNHASAGNVNDDIHVEFLKLYAFIPFEDEAVTVESFFWIPIAIVLSIIAGLLVWLQYEHK